MLHIKLQVLDGNGSLASPDDSEYQKNYELGNPKPTSTVLKQMEWKAFQKNISDITAEVKYGPEKLEAVSQKLPA